MNNTVGKIKALCDDVTLITKEVERQSTQIMFIIEKVKTKATEETKTLTKVGVKEVHQEAKVIEDFNSTVPLIEDEPFTPSSMVGGAVEVLEIVAKEKDTAIEEEKRKYAEKVKTLDTVIEKMKPEIEKVKHEEKKKKMREKMTDAKQNFRAFPLTKTNIAFVHEVIRVYNKSKLESKNKKYHEILDKTTTNKRFAKQATLWVQSRPNIKKYKEQNSPKYREEINLIDVRDLCRFYEIGEGGELYRLKYPNDSKEYELLKDANGIPLRFILDVDKDA